MPYEPIVLTPAEFKALPVTDGPPPTDVIRASDVGTAWRWSAGGEWFRTTVVLTPSRRNRERQTRPIVVAPAVE